MNKFILPNESCPYCGNDIEIHSTYSEKGMFYDGDDVRCVECKAKGYVSVVDPDIGDYYIIFDVD